MITQSAIVEKILAHLNGEISEHDLVQWAEDALVTVFESANESPDEQTIIAVLGYIGAGDSPGFPLTWEILSGFLGRLGTQVRVSLAV